MIDSPSARLRSALAFGLIVCLGPSASAQSLTIYDIQSNTVDGDASSYDLQLVNCTGGICVAKFRGSRPRLILQDPAHPEGWGGIQVKDWAASDPDPDNRLFEHVNVGDWVELNNVLVEEFRGSTFLEWQTPNSPSFTIVSTDNPIPPPILVEVGDIPAPVEHPGDEWYVENHDAERYESMRLYVRNVTVTEWNLGKAVDNYNLHGADGAGCWAADYMNEDVQPSGYHPFVSVGQHFCAVGGVFEQYTNLRDGWDYYQLITLNAVDLAICGDGNSDGDVDLLDLPRLQSCITGPRCGGQPAGCGPPAWTWPGYELPIQHCVMMDFDYDGDVDLLDYGGFEIALCGS